MPLTLDTLLDEPASALRLMLVEPGASAHAGSLSEVQHLPAPADAMLLVGALIVHMVGVRIYPRPTWVGKAATFFQILTVLAGLGARWFQLPLSPKPIVWVAAVFTVVSGLQYIVQGMRFLNTAHTAEHEEHESTLFRG